MATCLSLTIQPSSAEFVLRGISVKPAGQPYSNEDRTWLVHDMKPGDVLEDAVYIVNDTEENKDIIIYPADATPSSDGGFALKQKIEEMTGVGSWIKLSQYEFSMKPREAVLVNVTIAVPNDPTLDVGEHSGAILAQEKPKEDAETQAQGGIILTTRVGARVYITLPGEVKKEVVMSSFNYTATKIRSYNIPLIGEKLSRLLKIPGVYAFSVGFENKGNTSNDVKIKLIAKDDLFHKNDSVTESSQKVGRETEALNNFEWKVPLFGKYSFSSSITYNDIANEEKTLESEVITLWIIPYDLIAGIVLILLAIIVIIVIRKIKYSGKNWLNHKVSSKETLQSIAEIYGIRWQKLAKVNKMSAPYALQVGSVILVPPRKKTLEKKSKK